HTPQALALSISTLSPEEERASGAWEMLSTFHESSINAKLLGRASVGVGYTIYTSDPVESTQDFAGLRLRGTPTYLPMLNQLDADLMQMPWGDTYTALQQDLVDGFLGPEYGVPALGLTDVT